MAVDKKAIQLGAHNFSIKALREYYNMPSLTDNECIMLDEYTTFMNVFINGVEFGVNLKIEVLSNGR